MVSKTTNRHTAANSAVAIHCISWTSFLRHVETMQRVIRMTQKAWSVKILNVVDVLSTDSLIIKISFIRLAEVCPAIYRRPIVVAKEFGTISPHMRKILFLPKRIYPISKKLSGMPGLRSFDSR